MADFQKSLQEKYQAVATWLKNFFDQIDLYETLAVVAIALGMILFIVGLFLI